MLEEGDGPSMMSEESADAEDGESSVDTGEHPPPQPATATTAAGPASSLLHTPSTEDLSSAKKKPPSRIATSGLRAPTAGKSELMHYNTNVYFI